MKSDPHEYAGTHAIRRSDQLIDVTGRAVLQAVLQLSAAQVAGGPQQQGKRRPETRRVTNWQNGAMVRRWLASAFLRTEKNFRRIMGYRELWTLEAILSEPQSATLQAVA
jgi:hypothetical protein